MKASSVSTLGLAAWMLCDSIFDVVLSMLNRTDPNAIKLSSVAGRKSQALVLCAQACAGVLLARML